MAETMEQEKNFCRTYLHTMNPQRAAEAAGYRDGYSVLKNKAVRERLKKMRASASTQILREDIVRGLCELAFGRANDAVGLALSDGERDYGTLDLSAVSEFKVTDKGGVEIRFIDRIRALEALWGLLEGNTADGGAADFFRALENAGEAERQIE